MSNIKKAVIPIAGLGTRFLPIAKSVPKELVPIGTFPILQLIVEEAVSSGVKEIIFVTSPLKDSVKDYFSLKTDYIRKLEDAKKIHLLDDLARLVSKVKFTYVMQKEPKGLGDAILCAKKEVGKEPFLVLLPDIIIVSKTPCCYQLIDAYETTSASVNAVEHVPPEKIPAYGIYELESGAGNLRIAKRVVEKPSLVDAPSDIGVVGRYLFTPEVFDVLERIPPGKNGELQLADAQNELASHGKMFAYLYDGWQIDTGDELGFLKANIWLAMTKYKKQTEVFIESLKKIT